jgi:hypothetical protein
VVVNQLQLNARQVELLRRLADATSPVTAEETQLVVSLRAMRRRGYVSIPGGRGGWLRAQVTDGGRFYLEHGRAPDNHVTSARRSRPVPSAPSDDVEASVVTTDDVRLIPGRLVNGERVVFASPSSESRALLRRALREMPRHPLIAAAAVKVRHNGRSRGDFTIWTEPSGANIPAIVSRRVVEVPRRIIQPHPSISAAQTAWRDVHLPPGECRIDVRHRPGCLHLFVAKPSLPRVWSLAHAVFAEAKHRGYSITTDADRCVGPHINVEGFAFEISFWEEIAFEPHVPSAKEIADAAKYTWQRYPQFERVPTGRLQLRHGHDRAILADGTLLRIEDRLDEVFSYATECAAAAKLRAEAAERARVDRVTRWRIAMDDARQRFIDDAFDKAFLTQARGWRTAPDLRDYCETLVWRAAQLSGEQAASMREWIQWGRDLADRIDPVTTTSGKPAEARPHDHELAPNLNGWNIHPPS